LVCESHLQDGEIIDDWRSYGGDEEEDGSGEEEKGAKMVEDSSVSHFDCVDPATRLFGSICLSDAE